MILSLYLYFLCILLYWTASFVCVLLLYLNTTRYRRRSYCAHISTIMRLLQTAPLALLELVIAAIQAIEARPGARLLSRQSSPGNTTLAAPIIVEPSQHWEGVDGIWSTFAIRVGTPSSIFRVLPATSWQETWVVYGSAAGVCNATAGVTTDCQDDRGGVFDVTKSSSWVAEKQRPLDLNADLGYAGVGQYGMSCA